MAEDWVEKRVKSRMFDIGKMGERYQALLNNIAISPIDGRYENPLNPILAQELRSWIDDLLCYVHCLELENENLENRLYETWRETEKEEEEQEAKNSYEFI